jgi:membrane fusion protein (multidrug efflux system)
MEAASKETATNARARRAARAYMILAAAAAIVAGAWFIHRWMTKGKQSTDDAQVEADIVPISARVGGVILTAKVHDNQLVKQGDVLFEIDPAYLDVEVARTAAELEAAKAQQAAADAQVAIVEKSSSGTLTSAQAQLTGASASVRSAGDATRAAEASVARAKADLAQATTELTRTQGLLEKGAVTRRELEHAEQAHAVAKAAFDSANAQLEMARENRALSQARVADAQGRVTQSGPVDQQISAARAASLLAAARVKAAEAAAARAQLDRGFARVTAPASGVISRLGAHAGQTVMAGQALLMLVPTQTYVVANFKENQVGAMKAGDPVDIELDAFDGTFHGVVETVSPATGARFSLIPPDNATGNFVKVVQRVPVKIQWTKAPEVAMRPGLSAEVTVHVGE